ncbi:cytochrome-c oxidase [bacterium]|nr:cytochrome-c oxidase [bacterium]
MSDNNQDQTTEVKAYNKLYSNHDDHLHPEPTSIWTKYIFSFDHKVIAKQFLVYGLCWGFLGALMSVMIRWCLAQPGVPFPIIGQFLFPHTGGVIPPDWYSSLFTMHGTIMIFFALTPLIIGFLGNYAIPLMIGARDMLFPWLNMASFWVFFASGLIMLYSIFVPMGPSSVGWTSYPTLAHSQWTPGPGHSLWLVALFLAGVSSLMGAINYISTIIRLRAPGMRWRDLPLTLWGIFLTSILNALFLPVLAAGLLLLLIDREFGTTFFLAASISEAGTQGDPILYQHLFWIFGHPEVYIVILPAWGLVSDLLSFFARKPAFGYRATAISMSAISVLSALVYGHHMFTTGLSPLLTAAFTTLTLLISIPSGIFFLNWLGTLWRGSIRFTNPMLFSLGMVFTFGLGGLTGLHLAAVSTNIMLHNTYFVVGHFHLTMAASSLLASYAAVYFYFPKMYGRMMNKRLGQAHFWLSFVPIVYIFVTMMIVGYAGMHRRTYNPYEYNYLQHLLALNQYIGVAVAIAFFAQFIFVFNYWRSRHHGVKCGSNPWEIGTLEWTIPSPAPYYNFKEIPVVHNGPHELSNPKTPGRLFIPQDEYVEGVSHS